MVDPGFLDSIILSRRGGALKDRPCLPLAVSIGGLLGFDWEMTMVS